MLVLAGRPSPTTKLTPTPNGNGKFINVFYLYLNCTRLFGKNKV